MTVIATFSVGGWPILLGDILLSGPRNDEVSVPSIHLPNKIDFAGKAASVSGICQKLEIVSDQLCVGWAGRAIEARSFGNHLRRRCRGSVINWDQFQQIVNDFDTGKNLKETQFVAIFWTGSDFGSVDNSGSYTLG